MLQRYIQHTMLTLSMVLLHSLAADVNTHSVTAWIEPWRQADVTPDTRPTIPINIIDQLFHDFKETKRGTSNITHYEKWFHGEIPESLCAYLEPIIIATLDKEMGCYKPRIIPSKISLFEPDTQHIATYNKHYQQDEGSNDSTWMLVDSKSPYIEHQTIAPTSTIIPIGDLHGSMCSLALVLEKLVQSNLLNDDWTLPPDVYIALLGDFVDRGIYGVACWATLMLLYINNPHNVFLMRGNHEEYAMWGGNTNSLAQEVFSQYGRNAKSITILRQFMVFTELLPHALVLTAGVNSTTGKPANILLCHGGIQPDLDLKPFLYSGKQFMLLGDSFHGFSWSSCTGCRDNSGDYECHFNYNWYLHTARGNGYIASIEDIRKYFELNELSLMLRGHDDQWAWFKLAIRMCSGLANWHVIHQVQSYTFTNPHYSEEHITICPDLIDHSAKHPHPVYQFPIHVLDNCPMQYSYITAPVCTISIAADEEACRGFNEGKHIGTFILQLAEDFHEWQAFVHEYSLIESPIWPHIKE